MPARRSASVGCSQLWKSYLTSVALHSYMPIRYAAILSSVILLR